MLSDDKHIKEDIEASLKRSFTKNDAEYYYHNYLNNKTK